MRLLGSRTTLFTPARPSRPPGSQLPTAVSSAPTTLDGASTALFHDRLTWSARALAASRSAGRRVFFQKIAGWLVLLSAAVLPRLSTCGLDCLCCCLLLREPLVVAAAAAAPAAAGPVPLVRGHTPDRFYPVGPISRAGPCLSSPSHWAAVPVAAGDRMDHCRRQGCLALL